VQIDGVDMDHFAYKMQEILDSTKADYHEFLRTGMLKTQLAQGFVRLAQLDSIVRVGILSLARGNPGLDPVDHEDDVVEDILRLYNLVPWNEFNATRRCVLNPTFGEVGKLIGGADADLVIDGLLIDIKTVKRPLQRLNETLKQLVGYCLLSMLDGIDGEKWQISELGVYFSRHGRLIRFSIDELLHGDLNEAARWFGEKASESYPASNRQTKPKNRSKASK